jgi:phosphopantothenate---cysteine ligase (CTP)
LEKRSKNIEIGGGMMGKRILVTAGSTIVMIDKVRGFTNIFGGRTGTGIAKYFAENDQDVDLMTSSPHLITNYDKADIKKIYYRTFDDLEKVMAENITHDPAQHDKFDRAWQGVQNYDVIVHSSAVSDYQVDGVYIQDKEGKLIELDRTKKISSKHKALFIKTVQTKKLVDQIRPVWGFNGILVKFKLEVGISDEELIEIAKKSREASDADFIVANCLEWFGARAYIIGRDNVPHEVSRRKLNEELLRRVI